MVRPNDNNGELRCSLRSLANLPHERVWLAGHRPAWAVDVEHLPVEQGTVKHDNTWAIWRAIANCADISDEFVLMNDDYYLLKPVTAAPYLHAGPFDAWLAGLRPGSPTAVRAEATRRALLDAGRSELLSWERHVPLPVDRRWLVEVMAYADHWRARTGAGPLCKRSLYGSYVGLPGVQVDDCKIRERDRLPDRSWPMLSTMDASFRYGQIGKWIRNRFPDPSPYEAAAQPAPA